MENHEQIVWQNSGSDRRVKRHWPGIAKGLAAEDAAVVVNYASSKDGPDRVVADIKAKGGKAIAVQGDVAKPADVKKIFAETKESVRPAGHSGQQRRRL